MPFRTHLKDIELDAGEIVRLLKMVRGMVDRDVVPEGNDDCKDCRQLDEVVRTF